jgi:hypothetical protein
VPALHRLLSTLLDRRVVVTTPRTPLETTEHSYVALYVDSLREPRFACLIEVGLLAFVGAALALMPAKLAAEAVKKGSVDEALLENALEVLNVTASLFNQANSETVGVRFLALHMRRDLAASTAKAIVTPQKRIDLDVQIANFGGGRMAFLAIGS